MEFGLFEFSDQLNKYFRGELTKNELGMWGEKAFYDLLKGGYIENKKIKEILYKLPNKSLSFKQKLLLLFIKNRWYLLLAVMLKIFI